MARRVCFLSILLAVWAAAAAGPVRSASEDYALILNDPPLAAQVSGRKALEVAARGDRFQRIEAAQRNLRAELARRHLQVTGSVHTLLNAVFVRVTRDQAASLTGIAGVSRVSYMPRMRRQLDQAVQLIGAPGAWDVLGGPDNAGAGVKIGILDAGIDQNHPAFQDSSMPVPDGYPIAAGDDIAFTNNKVIVARSYVAQLSGVDPVDSHPDDASPRDRSGHGTAVAMIAAGARVTGPAGTIMGVAPKAWLGNYKVFGTPGINDETTGPVVMQALEDAFADGMDVVALPFGAQPTYGPLAKDCGAGTDICNQNDYAMQQAIETASSKGMAVVAAAGNDGSLGLQFPTLNSIETPGIASSAITVGATTNAHRFYATVQLTGGDAPADLQAVDALFGDAVQPAAPVTAALRPVDGLACSPLAAGSLDGAIALIQRGDCAFQTKVQNAENAGAQGVIFYLDDGNDAIFRPEGMSGAGIPAVMIGNTVGAALKDFLQANPDRPVTLDPALHAEPDQPDLIADFSSRGPSIGLTAIKPELVAVGSGIYTAAESTYPGGDVYDPTGYKEVSGTSFAVPMVAGAAALVKQANPGFSAAQIKSALVNTAVDVSDDQGVAPVTAAGAGKLNAAAAVSVGITAEPATLSFGAVNTLPVSMTLNLQGTGTCQIGVEPRNSGPAPTVSAGSVACDGGSVAVEIPSAFGSRLAAGSYEGFVTVSNGSTNLRVPYLFVAGDGQAYNIFPIARGDFTGIVGQDYLIALKLIDQYGVPVSNSPVSFLVAIGGGSISQADAQTDKLGIAAAIITLGPQTGDQVFRADAGGLSMDFYATARPAPSIATNGVVNAASFQAGGGVAPGSYVSIVGSALSDATGTATSSSLPLSLAGASVSFDVPSANLSVPGRLSYASNGLLNVQIPWELRNVDSALMKVNVGDASSAIYTLPVAPYAPAAFEFPDPSSGQRLAAALDENYALLTTANPARHGHAVQIYGNGLGPVSNQPASGEPSPASEPLARTLSDPVVTVGGVPAQVLFSGLTPDCVGLYQLNIVIPGGVAGGIQPLVIAVNGVASKPVGLPVE